MTPRSSDTDACPGALRLHAAADGMLARVRLPGGMLSGAQLRSLRELAEEFGDGCLELTSRANLQLRALRPGDAPALAARLRSAGLLPSPTHDNVRNIAAPPLPGSLLRALVGRLDLAIQADATLAALPGKFLFAIGQVPLASDVAAVPVPPSTVVPCPPAASAVDGPFVIRLGGHDTGLRAGYDDVVPTMVAAAHAFLAERAEQRSGSAAAWRLRELIDGPARITARLAATLGVPPDPVTVTPGVTIVPVDVAVPVEAPEPGDLIGVLPQEDGLAAVAALVPLGRLDGVPMRVLEAAELLVVTPWRGVVVADLPPAAAPAWADRLAGAGLAVAPGSPWSGVTACAGRPGCAKSLSDVRADATAAARFVDGLPVHWVGCARACGSPAGAHVRAEATTDGYLITRHPAGGGEPGVHVATAVRAGSASGRRAPSGDSGLIGPSTPAARPPMIGVSAPVTAATAPEDTATPARPGGAAMDRPEDRTAPAQPEDVATPARPGGAAVDRPEDRTAPTRPEEVATPARPGGAAVAWPGDAAASGLEDVIAVARRL
ncbi:precorrin-3B synthase [Actinoplanes subglobosus]|uniref:Precorrin-3B synthase n=1 Tax=Actinoplanes subglobosus TaxID=1547892 RepID=A0ABV8J8C3_9ACTN